MSKQAVQGTTINVLTPLCVAYLESNVANGQLSPLAMPPNYALFGIKANKGYKGKSKDFTTIDVDANGNRYTNVQPFRIYDNYQQSFKDFVLFVKTYRNYYTAGFWKATTAKGQFEALERAGYAAAGYAAILNKIYDNFVKIAKSKQIDIKTSTSGMSGIIWYLLGSLLALKWSKNG